MELADYIHSKRPALAKSSVNTYASMLRSLYFKLYNSRDVDIDKFNDSATILEYLKDLPPNKRKTVLSALFVISNNHQYKDQMMQDCKQYNQEVSTQEKTPQQKANWISTDDITKVYKTLSKQANLLYKKENLTSKDIQEIQDYIIVALLGGIFIPPRRSKDYVDMKIKDIDENLNYIDKKTMVFNSYKTAKSYGKQVLDIPPALLKILKKWISINPTSFLLFDSNKNQLTAVKVTQRMNRIFNGKISTNAMRHSYLTDRYKDTIKVNEALSNDLNKMGSSMTQSTVYIKR